jgi:hypothetical protein
MSEETAVVPCGTSTECKAEAQRQPLGFFLGHDDAEVRPVAHGFAGVDAHHAVVGRHRGGSLMSTRPSIHSE